MKYNLLGDTGLLVSELCFGTMTFGGEGMWEAVEFPNLRKLSAESVMIF